MPDGSPWPRISVVTPSYNQGEFIEETIRSVLLQGYPDLEYIVMDGGSTDGAVEIIEKYASHLSFWTSEKDRGQSHAINKGMARATGVLRAYLNSDDLLTPEALSAAAAAYQASPNADIFHGRCAVIDVAGAPTGKLFDGRIATPQEIVDLWGVWWQGRNWVQPEVFWTKRIADRIGPFREDLNYAMDFDYWCRAIVTGAQVARLEDVLAYFRIWPQQKSSAAERAASELRNIVRPYLWDRSLKLSAGLRRRLQADYLFDEKYRPMGLAPQYRSASPRARLWLSLRLLVRYPQLILSRALRTHVRKQAGRWLGNARHATVDR